MHIRNRLPTSALLYGPEDTRSGTNVTPISASSDKLKKLNKLRIFGCVAFPSVFKETKPEFSKFAPNIFIGIQSNSTWVLLNRRTGPEQRSEDCEFKEHIFPGMMCQDLQSQLGLRSNISSDTGDLDSRNQNKLQVPFIRANRDSSLTTGNSLENQEAKKIPVPDKSNTQIVTCSGRVASLNTDNRSSKGFEGSVSLVVRALNALHIEQGQDSTSLGAPSASFESLTKEQAFSGDKEA
ncbi:hypothetical protein K3495_g375 [Podosphaera aphanis]|nr:hypothetical protein K3495_g375 [Podosphaera aphanis]